MSNVVVRYFLFAIYYLLIPSTLHNPLPIYIYGASMQGALIKWKKSEFFWKFGVRLLCTPRPKRPYWKAEKSTGEL